MLKRSTTTLTIVFLILITNVEHWGSYATTEVANLDTIYDIKTHHLAKRMDLQICLGKLGHLSYPFQKKTLIL